MEAELVESGFDGWLLLRSYFVAASTTSTLCKTQVLLLASTEFPRTETSPPLAPTSLLPVQSWASLAPSRNLSSLDHGLGFPGVLSSQRWALTLAEELSPRFCLRQASVALLGVSRT